MTCRLFAGHAHSCLVLSHIVCSSLFVSLLLTFPGSSSWLPCTFEILRTQRQRWFDRALLSLAAFRDCLPSPLLQDLPLGPPFADHNRDCIERYGHHQHHSADCFFPQCRKTNEDGRVAHHGEKEQPEHRPDDAPLA